MNRFVTLAAVTAISATLVACSGSAPTSPSSLGSLAPAAQFPVSSDGSSTGGRVSAMADIVLGTGDASFIAAVAQMHQGLIQAGFTAEGRVAHPQVKWFAQQMEQENRQALRTLRALSSSSVPSSISLNAAQQQLVADLTGPRGNPADRVFTAAMQTELTALHDMYRQRATASGSASELRAFTADFADRLSNYLEILRELVNRVR